MAETVDSLGNLKDLNVAAAAPKAPLNLRIDDQARPMSVEGSPRFCWLPQDDDGGEIQTAYEIEVRDAAGKTVWSSGKVKSGQQAYVPYAGPALAPGRAATFSLYTFARTLFGGSARTREQVLRFSRQCGWNMDGGRWSAGWRWMELGRFQPLTPPSPRGAA